MAGGVQNPLDIETPLLFSICLCQQERQNDLDDRVDDLEDQTDG